MAKEENNMPCGDPRDYFYPNQYAFNPLPYSAIEDMPVIKDLINRVNALELEKLNLIKQVESLESRMAQAEHYIGACAGAMLIVMEKEGL